MRITQVLADSTPISSRIQNAWIDFTTMDASVVAVVSDVVRDGKPVVGFGFSSNGRYSQTELIRRRFAPRILEANPLELLNPEETNFDPERIWNVMMRNEKPGGHGERSVAVGVLDMALHDLVSKLDEQPLWRWLSDRYAVEPADESVFVYAAGGYYEPGKSVQGLRDEIRSYLDAGYTHVKMKIGAASLADDLKRIDAVCEEVGDASKVAVDANGRMDIETAREYAVELDKRSLFWFEEPGDPLDFELHAGLGEVYNGSLATGENLFSHVDARNLLRYGRGRSDRDFVQVDPALSYGLVEYRRCLATFQRAGWSSRRFIPHGGHQFSLHIAAALHLGGNESYPGIFQPFGGFADGVPVVDGFIRRQDDPGIGIEQKQGAYAIFRDLLSDSD